MGEVEGADLGREGEVLAGKYTLEAKLGAGAMGEVWRARDASLDRLVAIKLLRPEHARNPDLVARFLREARAANLVRHLNVVDVLEVGQDAAGRPFLVQELLEGKDLGAHLTALGHGMPVDEAMKILVPIVEAIAFAHGRGVVHRDIKPENVFLAKQAGAIVPKLLDFGISHVDSEGAKRMTATGVALGTPAYMSPEQIKGVRDVDERSDVWALGVLIHETLSGELPFKAETVADQFVQIATSDPRPLELAAPHAPRAIVRIVARCLKRAPDDRYTDAATLLLDLEAVVAQSKSGPQIALPAASGTRKAAATEALPAPPAPRPAPSRVARAYSLRPVVGPDGLRRIATWAAVALAALVAASLIGTVNPWSDDWSPGALTVSLLGGPSSTLSYVVAVALVAAAGAAGSRGWRLEPRSWAHFLAGAGAISISAVLVAATTGQAPWSALPWAEAFGAVGLAAMALRNATDAWLDRLHGNAALLAGAASAALFLARELVR